MKTWIWENDQLFLIQKDLQQLIADKVVKTVVSFNLVATDNPKRSVSSYSAILIYK
jgi:hypothetical protein